MKRLIFFILSATIVFFSGLGYSQERIVVAGGSLTEIIYALGAGDEVVGVDQTSSYPETVSQLPQIGYWKLLNIEGILSLNPTLFITWQDSEPSTIFKQVQDAKVKLLTLQRIPSNIEQLTKNIQLIAKQLNRLEPAQRLIADIQQKIAAIENRVSHQSQKVRVIFLLSIGNNMVAGKNTVADAIITLAGGENIAQHDSYRTYSTEALIETNPDVIVMTSQSVQKLGGLDNLTKIAGIEQTHAWKNHHIVTIDQAFILGMGPRITQAVEILYNGFYKD